LEEIHFNKVVIDHPIEKQHRHLGFYGTKNFRDLGGYRTVDGRRVRWGVLYRSDALHKFTDADLKLLSALSLNRIIDFRSDYEREQQPDRLPADANIRHVPIPILDASTALVQGSRNDLVKKLRGIDPQKYMNESYVGFVAQFTPAFRQFFRELTSAGGRPVLFHCTAGKDRTGFAAALLLRLLGVPHETVMQDYLLTNDYFLGSYKWNLVLARLMKGRRFADAIRGFMFANPHYLSAAFETLDREYTSFEQYVRDGLELSEADVDRFKTTYLE
jgi:protein-tyrosine phosphatase